MARLVVGWRRHLPTFVLAAIVAAMLWFILGYEECDATCSDWDYVHDLLLEQATDGRVRRWDHAPSVVATNGSSAEAALVSGAVYELNEVLSEAGILARWTVGEPAEITVTFISREEMDELARQHGVSHKVQGFCNLQEQDDGGLEFARIFVSRNLSEGQKWGTVLHELGHAMGLAGHTDRYLSSLFYQDFKGGARSDGFSADDRKLLSFLYRHVRPGAPEAEVRAAFDRHWPIRSP